MRFPLIILYLRLTLESITEVINQHTPVLLGKTDCICHSLLK